MNAYQQLRERLYELDRQALELDRQRLEIEALIIGNLMALGQIQFEK